MDRAAPQIRLRAADWGEESAAMLARIEGAGRYLATWRDMIETGRAKLLAIEAGAARGALIWRLERDGAESVLSVLAYYCDPAAGLDMTRVGLELAQRVGADAGVDLVRFWTDRPGLARKAQGAGFHTRFVCERAVA